MSGLERADTLTWIAESVEINPTNETLLLAMDPRQFVATMLKWGQYISDMRFPFGLKETDLREVAVPVLIVPGRDSIHPLHVAERLRDLLPQAGILSYPHEMADEASIVDRISSLFPQIEDFLSTT